MDESELETNMSYRDYSRGNSKVRYFVPQGYQLPARTKLLPACRMWINGDMTNSTIMDGKRKIEPVRPFYLWAREHIPNSNQGSLWKKWTSGWYKVLNMMMEAPENGEFGKLIREKGGAISEQEVQQFHDKGRTYLLAKYSYICAVKSLKWSASYWSSSINFQKVQEKGSDADKRRVGKETRWNKKHRTTRTVRKKKRSADEATLDIDSILGRPSAVV